MTEMAVIRSGPRSTADSPRQTSTCCTHATVSSGATTPGIQGNITCRRHAGDLLCSTQEADTRRQLVHAPACCHGLQRLSCQKDKMRKRKTVVQFLQGHGRRLRL
jgi:hypothetical protein